MILLSLFVVHLVMEENIVGKYFFLNNSLLENCFAQMNLTKYKKHQKNVWYIGLGNDRDSSINHLSQFNSKTT